MLPIWTFLIGLLAGAGSVALIGYEFWKRLRQQKYDQARESFDIRSRLQDLDQKQEALASREAGLSVAEQEVRDRIVTFQELEQENRVIKRELHGVDVQLRKLQMDRDAQAERQDLLDRTSNALAERYLKENVKWISKSLSSNNFVSMKQRLTSVIDRCREIGYLIREEEEAQLHADLKAEFEAAVRASLEREEQARIKAQIREEQRLEREIERELQQLERERAAIEAALNKALMDSDDHHTEQIEQLKARLAEAESRAERAKSRAQETRSGHVYVISNIGAFGENIYKIGMTRRLEPEQRIRELGDASVPFPFDVHMMVSCDDAPKLENALHRALHRRRWNRVNLRKEFFRVDLSTIYDVVREHQGEVAYVADPEALEYRQSITMSDEDGDFIESVYSQYSDEDAVEVE